MLSNADFLRDDNNIPNPDDEESETDDHIEERNWSTDTEQYTLSEEENNEDPSFNYYIGKDQKTKWKKALPPKNVRTRSENIITHLPGVKGEAKNAKSILDCWNLFIDDNILECIVTNTNIYIRNIQQNYSRERDANLTNLHEIKALLGIIYFLGVMKANKLNTDDAWARDSTGFELCRIAMSENRFRFLLRVIRFDDKATRNERLRQDKLAAVRLILDTFVKNCQKHYSPSEYTTVDEKLDAFRGKCNFRQYIPSKHNKYGIKLFALVDSKMFYTCNLEIYSGKNPEGPYNVSNSPSDVVERLCEPIKGTGRNVTMDNWFTSYSLALKLLQQIRLTIVGTLKRNKKEIPSEFVISRGRNVHTSVFGFQSEMTLLSYKPKENKVVLMLSTLHHDANIDDSTGELKKPEIIMFYNMTKGGVDMMDEMTATYNCARNSRRWPMVIFYSLLNIGAINSQIIHFENGNASKVKSRRHFLKTLSLDLIEEMVKVRTYQIILWAVRAYKTTSSNCVHSLAKIPLLTDYIESRIIKYDLAHLSTEDLITYEPHAPSIVKSFLHAKMNEIFENTNEIFRSFFVSGIPRFFRPNFYNIQFITDHGNFGKFLATIGAVKEPGCFCGVKGIDANIPEFGISRFMRDVNKVNETSARVPLQGYGGAVSVLMLESAAKASASMLGTASNYRQSQTFTKVCLDHGAMINESCTPIPHSMRSDVDLHAASPVAQNKQGRVQDLGRGFCPISIIQSPQTSHFATSKQLSILQCNINGLCSTATKIKLEEIMEIAEKQKIQIIALQETKLNEKYNLKYKNYNILRKDRNKEGGGLAFLIKNLYYEDIAINIPNTSDLEAQGIKVYLNQNKTIDIFNMYHPPNNKLIDDGTMAQFLTDNTIIVGDLNAKHQLWGCSTPNPRGKILSNLFDDNAFMCLNDGNPTHHSYSYNTAQALDISFSSPDIFHKCKWQILKSIGSDHLPILIEISTKTKTSSIKEKFWNFKKANWNLYQQNTNEDFRKAPTRIKDLEQNWISFKNTIIKAGKVSIPRGNIKKWIPNYTHQAKDIQTLITKRNELQKSAPKTKQIVELN
ncbi:hypothetical protein LAZ67_14003430 [Cordylochernes scorpioides]|uniref:PiggyBac transposable element-derived protein domain-containing protein n=1 Tax=Cordylochernes scorpioides TaxID=51811 RepID=A0ABY6L7J1_9ARAC|nr:hypothetical protein LAZ67_14003430 [Cordylochernes scorpioides]